MHAVAPVVSGSYKRKHVERLCSCRVNAVTDACAELLGIDKDTRNYSGRDVHYVIYEPPAVRITRRISGEETEALLLVNRRWWDAGVQAQKICNRASVACVATGTDGGHVLY